MNINGSGKEATLTTVAIVFLFAAMEAPDLINKIFGFSIGFGLLLYKYYARVNGAEKEKTSPATS